ncbi:MAG: MipA/OmpV family protein [Beijerinckiaceae bacterium]
MRLLLCASAVFLPALVVCVYPAKAADARPQATVTDENDDDDDAPLATGSSLILAPSGSPFLKDQLFEPLAAKNWSVEIGATQRWSSRLGKRRAIEGATGLTLDIVWLDTFFVSSDRGAGVNLFRTRNLFTERDRFTAGVSFNADDQDQSERSRTQSRSVDAKRGISTFALGFAEYQIDRWRFWAEAAQFVSHDKGKVLSLGLEYRLPLTQKWSTTFATGASFGDGAYMRNSFSVPPNSVASRSRPFVQPKAGARDFTVSVDFEYRADEHWHWNIGAGFTKSLAVIQQGTFVKVRSQPFINAGIKYKF